MALSDDISEVDVLAGTFVSRLDYDPDSPIPTVRVVEREEEDEMVPTGADQRKVMGPGPLGETWWLLNDEQGEMADLYQRAGTALDNMFKLYKVKPVKLDNKFVLFQARFEFPQFDEELQHPEGRIRMAPECLGFVDFLTGFPMKNTEMMGMLGEWSSRQAKITAVESEKDYPVPPIPEEFFEGLDPERLLLNYLYLMEDYVEGMADELEGEEEPKGLHWWTRINLQGASKFPVPGEFMGLVNRAWPTLPWGEQETSPYFFSGNWMDTVFYTSATITEIIEPADGVLFRQYKVKWRTTPGKEDGEKTIRATDFAEYKVGDRVTVLKGTDLTKQSQLWKDADMKEFGKSWAIAPITFYGMGHTAAEQVKQLGTELL